MEFNAVQLEYLKILAEGWGTSEIARRRGISRFTAIKMCRHLAVMVDAKSPDELREKAKEITEGL